MVTPLPLHRDQAFAFIREKHRHSDIPPASWKYGLGLERMGILVAVGIAGKPVARGFAVDRHCIEVTRVATLEDVPGAPGHSNNLCSQLYGRLCRAARELGYRVAITYTRADEPGTSLVAAGFICTGFVTGREFSCKSRPRRLRGETPDRFLWERRLS